MELTKRQKECLVQNAKARVIGSRHKAMKHWFNMLNRVRRKYPGYAHVEVRITREEFVEWFMPRDFEGATVDRIDSKGHYEFSNMQVITRSENTKKVERPILFHLDGLTQCRNCYKSYPIELFKKRKNRSSGRTRICMECNRAAGREYAARERRARGIQSRKNNRLP